MIGPTAEEHPKRKRKQRILGDIILRTKKWGWYRGGKEF